MNRFLFILFMQISKKSFDTVCKNTDCINNRTAFFNYSKNSHHIIEKHPIEAIHPLFVESFFTNEIDEYSLNLATDFVIQREV